MKRPDAVFNTLRKIALFPLLVLILVTPETFAGSATWKLSPTTGDWNTATNWTPETVPNQATDTATFAASNMTSVSIGATTDWEKWSSALGPVASP